MSRHGHKEIERIKKLAAKMNTASLTSTQQELNVRFAKALGYKTEHDEGCDGDGRIPTMNVLTYRRCSFCDGKKYPNYFAPENFHLVRAAVGALFEIEKNLFYNHIKDAIDPEKQMVDYREFVMLVFLSPVEHIITAYLKVKEAN